MPDEPTLAEVIEQEARDQALERPDWVAQLLGSRVRADARGLEVAAAVKEFRRSHPWWLKTSEGGLPASLEDEDVHGTRRSTRERRPDGTYAPAAEEPKPTVNDAFRALARGDTADPRLVRLTTSPAAPGTTEDRGGTDAGQ